MKKLLALLFVMGMVTVVGCGAKDTKGTGGTGAKPTEVKTTEAPK